MKNIKKYIVLLVLPFVYMACDINDPMDEVVLVGKMAPHVYWEVGSSTVNAGSNVPFKVQYYSTSETAIDRLEVWYTVFEEESKVVSCPWTQTFNYNVVLNKNSQKRINQKIASFTHNSANWNDTLRAYYFEGAFPTSNTLSNINWVKPSTFDQDKMISYFGANFMTQFKDSLYKMMKVTDFQKMYLGLNLVENFKIYLDSTKNENTGAYDYHFPKNAQGESPVPQAIVDIYKTIPFQDLIFNPTTNTFDVEFNRSYKINATIRAYDKENVFGISMSSDISLN